MRSGSSGGELSWALQSIYAHPDSCGRKEVEAGMDALYVVSIILVARSCDIIV